MLYMIRPGVRERLEEFVKNRGTLITTYWSGIVNENDLCFLGGLPALTCNKFGQGEAYYIRIKVKN